MHKSALGIEVLSVVEDILVGTSGKVVVVVVVASETVSLVVGASELLSLAMEVWSVWDTGSMAA